MHFHNLTGFHESEKFNVDASDVVYLNAYFKGKMNVFTLKSKLVLMEEFENYVCSYEILLELRTLPTDATSVYFYKAVFREWTDFFA